MSRGVMNARGALDFVEKHGAVLLSGRGPLPNLAEAIAGGPIRGSWWAHPRSHDIFRVFTSVRDSDRILVCRLVGGKLTLVHRRLWPALVRLAGHLPKSGLAAIRDEHTASGRHRVDRTPYPRWVPRDVLREAGRLSLAEARALAGPAIAGARGD